jgi:putative ubiquitin-RnfH superfamily antitoxin RatB of RatAB toxin-antitoxin module
VTNHSPAQVAATLTDVLHVTLVYSPAPREVKQHELQLPKGTTVAQAIEQSGLLNECPDINLRDHTAFVVGIWGRKTTLNHVLRDLDRLEIYRPLLVDPKVARRERFQKQGTRGAGLFAKRRPGAKPGY